MENEDVLGETGERGEEVNRCRITRGEEHGNSEPKFRHTTALLSSLLIPYTIRLGALHEYMNVQPAVLSIGVCPTVKKVPPLPFISLYRYILSLHNLKNQLKVTLLFDMHNFCLQYVLWQS